ncbi:hypothetical protein [Streptomyces sp. RKAG293]|uniref:hypothetical protein n=1 Tax=Streptomyces sp. RKAG293 TaxID=2893403 RepID=UPI0020342D4B|nr:hypothetical protein [Streptomyces sp. RKAG293]MCM2420999.1 hypothetical protein [Streptomyces sp. RKAG293]
MLAQTLHSPVVAPDPTALGLAMMEPETALSDAPVYSPQAIGGGILLLGLLLSPSQPKEPKDK